MHEQHGNLNQEQFPHLSEGELQAIDDIRTTIAEWRTAEANESGVVYRERLAGVTGDGTFLSVDERSGPHYGDPASNEGRFVVRTAEVSGLAVGGAATEERLAEGGPGVMRFRGRGADTKVILSIEQGKMMLPASDSGTPPSINGKRIFQLPSLRTEPEQPQPSVEAAVTEDIQQAPEQVAKGGLSRWFRKR